MTPQPSRREFLKEMTVASAAFSLPAHLVSAKESEGPTTPREYLKEILYSKQEVDDWLAGKAFPFAKYSSEFGWLLNSVPFKDGIDDSISAYTYVGEDGERLSSNYSDRPCRINTYGDSFTQCHQVSDHETWQEGLAAHLQEPIRNFGIGGWSVYQAYLRMLKEEKRTPAEYIIFNIYDDDHNRNLDSWRNIRRRKHPNFIEPTLPYVKVNAHTGSFEEHPNPCPTPESLYKLCDLDETYKIFKDDFALKIMVAHRNADSKNPNLDYKDLADLTTTHGIETEIENSQTLEDAADELHQQSALFASMRIVEKIQKFADENGKKVLYVLSFPSSSIAKRVERGKRWDQPFVDFMKEKELPMVDLMESHLEDHSDFKIPIREYLKRYYIGHYSPIGKTFCAFAIKDALVDMLDPKPVPYR